MKSKQVSFAASEELHSAIELLAYTNREPVSATVRRILTREMIDYGMLSPNAPVTEQTFNSNSRYRPKARHAGAAR